MKTAKIPVYGNNALSV